jgi:hypothetical protein
VRIIVRLYCYAFAVINYLFEFNVRDGRHQRDTQRYSLLDFGIGSIFGISASLLLVELKAHAGGALLSFEEFRSCWCVLEDFDD